MPINADNSPNILWPLPEGKPAVSRNNLFSAEIFSEIQQTVKDHTNWGPGSEETYHTIPGRWVSEVPFSQRVKDEVTRVAKKTWENEELELKILWVGRYQKHNGVTPYLWEHMDQAASQYTLDFCVEAHKLDNWGIIVDDELFSEEENSGLFFMGQQHSHSRPPYPVDDPEAYIILMFGLFVDPSHWAYGLDLDNPEDDEKFMELIQKYRYDGDIRYYEYSGHPPYFNDLPETNPVCAPNGEECIQCWVPSKEFLDGLIEERSGNA